MKPEERQTEGMEALIDAAPSLISIWDAWGRIQVFNRACQALTGFQFEEVLGKVLWEVLIPKEFIAQVQGWFGDPQALDRSRRYEVPLLTREGDWRWVEWRCAPVQAVDGWTGCVIGVGVDISERRREEILLQGEIALLEQILRGAPLPRILERMARFYEWHQPRALCSILLLEEGGKTLRNGASPSLPDDYAKAVNGLAVGEGMGSCGTAVARRSLVIVEDIQKDQLWVRGRESAQKFGLRACWSMPIMTAGNEVLGTFAVYYREPRLPVTGELQLVELMTRLVGLSVERSFVEQKLAKAAADLRRLSTQLLEAQENERRRLARELHDEVGQILTALQLRLGQLKQQAGGGLAKGFAECEELLFELLDQVRDLSLELRPSLLDDMGLVPALRWLLERQSRGSQIAVRFDADPLLPRLKDSLETCCFRLVQECLTNVRRHAGVCQVRVALRLDGDLVRFQVDDNGVGFDVAAMRRRAAAGSSLGLLSLEERAYQVGGGLLIDSTPGGGTRIEGWLPLECEEMPELGAGSQA